MAESKENNCLPDLGNEMTGEQVLFERKVFSANEAFIWLTEEIIAWFKSPNNQKYYPKSQMKNKIHGINK